MVILGSNVGRQLPTRRSFSKRALARTCASIFGSKKHNRLGHFIAPRQRGRGPIGGISSTVVCLTAYLHDAIAGAELLCSIPIWSGVLTTSSNPPPPSSVFWVLPAKHSANSSSADPRKDVVWIGAIAYPRADLRTALRHPLKCPYTSLSSFKMIEADNQDAHCFIEFFSSVLTQFGLPPFGN